MTAVALSALRARIRALEGSAAPGPAAAVEPLPFAGPEAALPGGGLALGGLHQVIGADESATGFAALVAGRLAERLDRPVLWIPAGDDLYPPGLAAWGLAPGRLILACAGRRNESERLWAMEEGLRCPDLACVVGEVARLPLTAGRRLQLAAEAGGVTGVILHAAAAGASNAGITRWRVAAAPGGRWRLALERCRGGRPGEWEVDISAPDRAGR
jgi:protein ImuA